MFVLDPSLATPEYIPKTLTQPVDMNYECEEQALQY
jgi:hypothetical protein